MTPITIRQGAHRGPRNPSAVEPPPRTVRTGELAVGGAPERLAIFGLGSCVAIFIGDASMRLGGLAHASVPAAVRRSRGTRRCVPFAIHELVEELEALGCSRKRLGAKLVGGAHLLHSRGLRASGEGASASAWVGKLGGRGAPLGARNVAAALLCLGRKGIRLDAVDVGGSASRCLVVNLDDGLVHLRSSSSGERFL